MQDARERQKKSARLEDIAREAGVSISTVSRALNDSPAVKRRTKQEIWKIARAQPSRKSGRLRARMTMISAAPCPMDRSEQMRRLQ